MLICLPSMLSQAPRHLPRLPSPLRLHHHHAHKPCRPRRTHLKARLTCLPQAHHRSVRRRLPILGKVHPGNHRCVCDQTWYRQISLPHPLHRCLLDFHQLLLVLRHLPPDLLALPRLRWTHQGWTVCPALVHGAEVTSSAMHAIAM